jgi:hypothetical protein
LATQDLGFRHPQWLHSMHHTKLAAVLMQVGFESQGRMQLVGMLPLQYRSVVSE